MFELQNNIVIITGAGRGNGKGIANGLSNFGAEVIGIDLNFDEKDRCNFIKVKGDVSKLTTINKVCHLISKSKKKITLINNAGISIPIDGEFYNLENWDKTLKINLTSPFLWIEKIKPFMIKKRAGSIINITSLSAELGFPDNPAYVAAKGGLKMLGKAFAKDLGRYNIKVNNVGPGYIQTNMTKKSFKNPKLKKQRDSHILLNRWGTPNDLVGVCAFLISEFSSYITGQDIYVDGGWLANGLINN